MPPVYRATMPRKAARDRPALAGAAVVRVECPRCRVRLAEAWPEGGSPSGWDGMVFAERLRRSYGTGARSLYEVDNPPWRCQRCKAVHPVDDAELGRLVRAAGTLGRRDVTLGERLSVAATWRSASGS